MDCHNSLSRTVTPGTNYQWRPRRWTGGSSALSSAISWSCPSSYTINTTGDLWVARSPSFTYRGFFTIVGVSGKSNQKNSSSHKLTFVKDSGVSSAAICGKDNFPIYATQVREK